MTKLSVNVNKVALLRNARGIGVPDVFKAAALCLDAGAHGITVHPRPDGRHVRPADVRTLATLIAERKGSAEFNVEGYPSADFLALVAETQPTQCTLVPDPPEAQTSTAGWNLVEQADLVRRSLQALRTAGIRTALFVSPDPAQIRLARECGADRVELFTTALAAASRADDQLGLGKYVEAARQAQALGMGVNAGHDLSLPTLPYLRRVPNVLEVSIGQAFVADALELGYAGAVKAYLRALNE